MNGLRAAFTERFGGTPRIFRAPGRVNLIGEHTDYNEGFVMPAAIQFATRAAIAPRKDRTIRVFSTKFPQAGEIDLDEGSAKRRGDWTDYVFGVAVTLESAGHKLRGADMAIEGEVPIGSGLSSSAALEVSTAMALLVNSGIEMGRTETALLCQRAENEFVGARTGIMDQFVACHGREGHALLLDCRSLVAMPKKIPDTVKLVVCNTKVKHELAGGEYNRRRAECEEGVEVLKSFIPGLYSLRDVTEERLEEYARELPPLILRRCRHVVTENARVLSAGAALDRDDMDGFGGLMLASHRSLRDDFEVSCAELDILVDIAERAGRGYGVHGARMTGGGFGGCTVNLVESAQAEKFADFITGEYQRRAGREGAAYVCIPSAGAGEDL
ncbi:MAG: galactokinase [Acidobacteriota bacterium]|nr:galactokinase [Acidobacteriota bacterium]